MEKTKKKLRWGRTLKPGDTICDCRYLHIKIKEIKEERGLPLFIHKILEYFPIEIKRWANRLGTKYGVIYDYTIILEDGGGCSLIHCCDNPDTHSVEEHHRNR